MFWALLLGFSLYSEPVVCGVGLVIMLTGVPVYFLGVHWKAKPKCIYDFIGECPPLESCKHMLVLVILASFFAPQNV